MNKEVYNSNPDFKSNREKMREREVQAKLDEGTKDGNISIFQNFSGEHLKTEHAAPNLATEGKKASSKHRYALKKFEPSRGKNLLAGLGLLGMGLLLLYGFRDTVPSLTGLGILFYLLLSLFFIVTSLLGLYAPATRDYSDKWQASAADRHSNTIT
jgi:hypothetical protein